MAQELKGSKTQANLLVAFSGESQAAQKYTMYAAKADKDGYRQIAEIFRQMAENERSHARLWFRLLNGQPAETMANLEDAARGENYEWREMYAMFSQTAREEGFEALATLLHRVGEIEHHHERRFLTLRDNIEHGRVFSRPHKAVWICRNCGHITESPLAPQICPVCGHKQEYFELYAENF